MALIFQYQWLFALELLNDCKIFTTDLDGLVDQYYPVEIIDLPCLQFPCSSIDNDGGIGQHGGVICSYQLVATQVLRGASCNAALSWVGTCVAFSSC